MGTARYTRDTVDERFQDAASMDLGLYRINRTNKISPPVVAVAPETVGITGPGGGGGGGGIKRRPLFR